MIIARLESDITAAFGAYYKTIFVAGPSFEDIHEVGPVKSIVEELV